MTKVALMVRYKIAPGKKNQLRQLLLAHVNRTLSNERGCLQFEVLEPLERGDEIRLFELYQDEEALEAHTNSAHLAEYLDSTDGLLLEREVLRCRVAAVGR